MEPLLWLHCTPNQEMPVIWTVLIAEGGGVEKSAEDLEETSNSTLNVCVSRADTS